MNHEETEHMRDRFFCAALTGSIANPHRICGVSYTLIVEDAMKFANEAIRQRREYYEAQDKNDSSKA